MGSPAQRPVQAGAQKANSYQWKNAAIGVGSSGFILSGLTQVKRIAGCGVRQMGELLGEQRREGR
jgi:hypothetical protein